MNELCNDRDDQQKCIECILFCCKVRAVEHVVSSDQARTTLHSRSELTQSVHFLIPLSARGRRSDADTAMMHSRHSSSSPRAPPPYNRRYQ
jgi:hypothetical protein